MSNFDQKTITGVAALLVHVAKIDEKYSSDEKKLITNFIKSYIQDINSDGIIDTVNDLITYSNTFTVNATNQQ